MPTVEVTLCKDCRFRDTSRCHMRISISGIENEGFNGIVFDSTDDNGYCYLGEPIEEEDDDEWEL